MTRHLTVADVTAIAALAFGGTPPELRTAGLLESAVHRPRARMFGVSAYEDVYEQAGALLHGVAANHPFVDGNKRTAWLCAVVFLALNGVDLARADQDRAYDLVVSVAAGQVADPAVIGRELRAL
ncbi:type II toxin-antitoxin system death-on-curing family toxin [Streptomyces xantholiticus]|uniref:Type II toxin-antitoxin system death-on-curing family toxin n=1 Tax=Streptomyces xantholiticus TaxID=68285 RepID=A0ABV1V0P4_9ACTN|nr:type II toxin-antitoxin system death-on-curing family toxin [Streptomyces peucetius subsp. caesius ATCC 27952]